MRHNLCLRIAGVLSAANKQLYWDFGADYGKRVSVNTGQSVLRTGLMSVGNYSESLADDRSVSTTGVVQFVLPYDDGSKLGERPVDIFGHVGESSFDAGQIYSTPGCTAGQGTIAITKLSGTISTPFYLHIGTECIDVRGPATISSGSVYNCTVYRGQFETLAQPHRASGSGFLARTIPLTAQPCVWIGRKVYLYVDGVMWREMYLVDNPVLSNGTVILQAVGMENKLTVQRNAAYTPTYGTTLAPLNAQLETNGNPSWAPIWAREPYTASMTWGAASTSWYNLLNSKTISGIIAADGQRLRQLAQYASTGSATRTEYNPSVTLVFQGDVEFDQQLRLDLWETGWWPDQSSPNSAQRWNQLQFSQSPVLTALASGNTTGRLVAVDFGGCTYWNPGNGSWADPTDSDYSSPGLWYVNNPSPFSVGFWGWGSPTGAVLQLRWRANPQSGFLSSDGPTLWGGVLSRRNRRPDEDVAPILNNDLWAGLPRWGGWSFGADSAQLEHLTYGVRPEQPCQLHNEVYRNGVIATVDMIQGVAGMPFGPRCYVADTWWEMGMGRVQLLQELPIGSGGPVTITYVDPDGTEFAASAIFERDALHDLGSYYAYRVLGVKMQGTDQPCVGFGSWPNQPVCQITRPVGTSVSAEQGIGTLLGYIVSSDDGTSGRQGDVLGDGMGVHLRYYWEITSLTSVLPAPYHYTPNGDMSYDQLIETALLLSSSILRQCRYSAGSMPGLLPVYAGKPAYTEIRATITDDDIIGTPTSSGSGCQIFTGYTITCGSTTYTVPDWLAADLLGTGDNKEIDLTEILDEQYFTAVGVQQLVAELRSRFGTQRVRWSFAIPIEKGLDLAVGDVLQVTSQWLVNAGGKLGATQEVARIVSLVHDWQAGTTQVETLAWAEYSTGYNLAQQVYCEGGSGEVELHNEHYDDLLPDDELDRNYQDYWDWWVYKIPAGTNLIYYSLTSDDQVGGVGLAYPVTLVLADDDSYIYVTSDVALPAGHGLLCLASSDDAPYSALAMFGRDKLC